MEEGDRVPGSGTLIRAEESGAGSAFRPGTSDVACWAPATWSKAPAMPIRVRESRREERDDRWVPPKQEILKCPHTLSKLET